MNLDAHLLTGFNILINFTVTINGETLDCVYNELANSNRKDYTFIDESDCSIMVRTSDIGKIAVLNEDTWKVIKVKTGPVTTTFTLISNTKI